MAPDFDRFARMPWPIDCWASSGIKLLSSAFAFSCSRCASRVRIKTPANSAQALEVLISTMQSASMRGFGGSNSNRVGETKTLKPIDKVFLGEITSHRAVTTVNANVASKMSETEGRARNRRAKATWGAEI